MSVTSAPKTARMSRSWSPGCSVRVGQCGTVTEPPVTAAAARNGAALDRSGSTTTSRAAMGPAATAQRSARLSSTSTPRSRSMATVIAMWGSEGTGGPACRISSPPASRAPTSSSALTYCDEVEASRVTVPPREVGPPGHGERQAVPVAVGGDLGAEVAQRAEQRLHRTRVRLRVAVEGDRAVGQQGQRRDEAHHGAGEAAVDGPAAGEGSRAGSPATRRPTPRRSTPRVRSASRISWVSRASRPFTMVEGPSASAASTSARLVSDFEPGTVTVAVTGTGACGAGQGWRALSSVGVGSGSGTRRV